MVLFVAVKVAYFTSEFHGWQIQPKVPTIEGVLQQTLIKSKLIKPNNIKMLKYAGRTDRGVNAIGQTIVFPITNYNKIPDRFLHRINAFLPEIVRCWAYAKVTSDFHPRYDAKERIYQYHWYEPGLSKLDWNQVEKYSQILVGYHDFQNFTKKDKVNQETQRSITSIRIFKNQNDSIIIELRAPSFLWQQCRRLAGHILQVAKGEVDSEATKKLLEVPTKNKPPPLPPENLILYDVIYPNIKFHKNKDILKIFLRDYKKIQIEHRRRLHTIGHYLNEINSILNSH